MMDIEKEQAMKPISEIEIKSLLPDEDVYINTDITRLKQVICNFINNARKFTSKKDIFILGIRLITEMRIQYKYL